MSARVHRRSRPRTGGPVPPRCRTGDAPFPGRTARAGGRRGGAARLRPRPLPGRAAGGAGAPGFPSPRRLPVAAARSARGGPRPAAAPAPVRVPAGAGRGRGRTPAPRGDGTSGGDPGPGTPGTRSALRGGRASGGRGSLFHAHRPRALGVPHRHGLPARAGGLGALDVPPPPRGVRPGAGAVEGGREGAVFPAPGPGGHRGLQRRGGLQVGAAPAAVGDPRPAGPPAQNAPRPPPVRGPGPRGPLGSSVPQTPPGSPGPRHMARRARGGPLPRHLRPPPGRGDGEPGPPAAVSAPASAAGALHRAAGDPPGPVSRRGVGRPGPGGAGRGGPLAAGGHRGPSGPPGTHRLQSAPGGPPRAPGAHPDGAVRG